MQNLRANSSLFVATIKTKINFQIAKEANCFSFSSRENANYTASIYRTRHGCLDLIAPFKKKMPNIHFYEYPRRLWITKATTTNSLKNNHFYRISIENSWMKTFEKQQIQLKHQKNETVTDWVTRKKSWSLFFLLTLWIKLWKKYGSNTSFNVLNEQRSTKLMDVNWNGLKADSLYTYIVSVSRTFCCLFRFVVLCSLNSTVNIMFRSTNVLERHDDVTF